MKTVELEKQLRLQLKDYFSDNDEVKVVDAFPNMDKPTRLDVCVIATGLQSVDIQPAELEGDTMSGSVGLFFDIYVPKQLKIQRIHQLFEEICGVMREYNIISITAEKVSFDKKIQAFYLSIIVTVNDVIDFGGAEDE